MDALSDPDAEDDEDEDGRWDDEEGETEERGAVALVSHSVRFRLFFFFFLLHVSVLIHHAVMLGE